MVSNNLSQTFSKISIESPVSAKKVTPQSPEFVPAARVIASSTSGKKNNYVKLKQCQENIIYKYDRFYSSSTLIKLFFVASPNFFNSFAALAGTTSSPGFSRLVDSTHSATVSPHVTPQPSPPPLAISNCSPIPNSAIEKPIGTVAVAYQVSTLEFYLGKSSRPIINTLFVKFAQILDSMK